MKLLNVAWLTLFFVNFESSHQTTTRKKVFNVTLVVFSGRPDPTWLIPSRTVVFNKIQNALNRRQGLDPSRMPETLGYRGFLVRAENDKKEYLILGKSTVELQNTLLNSAPPGSISSELKSYLAKIIPTVQPLTHSHAITKRKATIYNGATRSFWNKDFVRIRNNCYNYATDKPTNTFAWPGRGTGRLFAQMTGVEVRDAARRDGLILYNYVGRAPPPIPRHPTRHLVALFVDPFILQDFHWYRLDSNNRWSHKRGETRATNRDDGGHRIVDPRNANTGTYNFVAFMFVDKNSATIW